MFLFSRMEEKERQEIIRKVEEILTPLLTYEGLSLVDIEYQRERVGWVLRVYIDKEEGVTVNDCARISRELGQILDVEDFIPYSYHLEVSSPGIRRPLRRQEDFQRFAGERVKIKTSEVIEGRKNFTGEILGCYGETVRIIAGGKVYDIPLSSIAKAHLEPEIKF